MALDVYLKDDIANILSSNMSMAIATARSTLQATGQLDKRFLFGVFSAQCAVAKGFGLSWPAIVGSALSDIGEFHNDGLIRAADHSLERFISEVERHLLIGGS
jgi:hypothetical protein